MVEIFFHLFLKLYSSLCLLIFKFSNKLDELTLSEVPSELYDLELLTLLLLLLELLFTIDELGNKLFCWEVIIAFEEFWITPVN